MGRWRLSAAGASPPHAVDRARNGWQPAGSAVPKQALAGAGPISWASRETLCRGSGAGFCASQLFAFATITTGRYGDVLPNHAESPNHQSAFGVIGPF